jgi:DMSO/TMAO reductase YedYZ molybdopterin-dependent catalytic subunit
MTHVRDSLPVHAGRGPSGRGAGSTLRIDGLVRNPGNARAADLAGLPRAAHAEPFSCEEGWAVPEIAWGGVRLSDAVALAGPLPAARYVRVHAGNYVVPVPLDGAAGALLCDEMNGRPLPAAHGAPWRLLVPGGRCFTSVKWVDRLELTAAPGAKEGERMARARLRSGGPEQAARRR